MEDLIGILFLLLFGGVSLLGKMMKNQDPQQRKGQGRPQWPGPVSGPGIPTGQPQWPQRPLQPSQPWPQSRQAQPQWPGQPQPQWPGQPQPQWPGQPQPGPQQAVRDGEGVASEGWSSMLGGSIEGRSSMLGGSIEGRSSMLGGSIEGRSSESSGSLADERARFASQSDRFRRSRPETALHHPGQEAGELGAESNPIALALASKEGLAQAVLLSEVLGAPRALRPYGRR